MTRTTELLDTLRHFEPLAELLMQEMHDSPELHSALRTKEMQPFWERIHLLALFGLNMVSGGNLPESGEEVVFDLLSNAFRDRRISVFDVGANVGDYTALALAKLGLRAQVLAFEPLPGNFALLRNRFVNEARVSLIQSAVGATEGSCPFFVNAETSTIGSLVQRSLEHENIEMKTRVEVPVTTIDAFCIKNGIEQIDLLKIDVEGADFHVLEGAVGMRERGRIGMIQFEFSGAQIDARNFFKDFYALLAPKYRMFRIASNGLFEITSYGEQYEIFWCTNYLAIIRG